MYLRTKDDAMGALAEILELDGRPRQIVQATVQVALCLSSEARNFMMDVQAGVIEGGLEALRRRRQEALAQVTETKIRRHAPGIDLRRDPLLEPIGVALDLLKMVDLLTDVFPGVGARHPKWEVARFIHENQSYTREILEAGLRRRGKPEHAELQSKVLGRIEEKKPWWPEWVESIRQACLHYGRLVPAPPEAPAAARDPETLFHVITMSEERAREVLQRMAGTSEQLGEYLAGIRSRVALILAAQREGAA